MHQRKGEGCVITAPQSINIQLQQQLVFPLPLFPGTGQKLQLHPHLQRSPPCRMEPMLSGKARHRLPKSVAHLLSIPPSAQLDTLASPTSTRKDKCHRGTAYSASIGACAVFVSQAVADTLKISTLDFMLDTHQMYGLNVYVPVLQAASHLVFPVVYLL